jgi:hypothetical protein
MKVLPFLLLICFGCVTPLDNILLENATEEDTLIAIGSTFIEEAYPTILYFIKSKDSFMPSPAIAVQLHPNEPITFADVEPGEYTLYAGRMGQVRFDFRKSEFKITVTDAKVNYIGWAFLEFVSPKLRYKIDLNKADNYKNQIVELYPELQLVTSYN